MFAIDDRDACALLVILSVVTDPSLAEHLMPEAKFIIWPFAIEGILRKRIGGRHFESMRRRPHPDHGSAAMEVVIEVLHLLGREILKPQEHDRQIGGIERFHAGHIRVARDDLAGRPGRC